MTSLYSAKNSSSENLIDRFINVIFNWIKIIGLKVKV